MSLTNQVYLYSCDTSTFYQPDEQEIHRRMAKMYSARAKLKTRLKDGKTNAWDSQWRVSAYNRCLAKHKERLSVILDQRVSDGITRQLNSESLKDRNVINLFESSLTRALNLKTFQLTKDLLIVNVFFFQVFENLVKQGFDWDGEHYIFLTASAGQIRTKRAVFIREAAFRRVEQRLMCGLTIEDINRQGGMNCNKFLAYLALMNSATDVWEDFDIDKSIVVDDFETMVSGEVDHIDGLTYEIKRELTDTPIPHMDGCGIMLDKPTRMVRLPWVKGLMVYFPYDKFLREKCTPDQWWVTDIYGQRHNVVLEDIRYIFTKSQFKLWKYYASWECYKARFKAYGCEASFCNIEEAYIPKSRINYQMIQTLSDMTDGEIERLTKRTVDEIEAIGADYQTTMRLLGATTYNRYKSAVQAALEIYPELFKDAYSREILKQTKQSLVKQARGGRLRVNGKYLFLSPDLYAFCEWLFKGEQNPRGLLADGEVYTNQYRDGDELACLRSPHLYREWAVKTNTRTAELDKWFGDTKCIYTSTHDLISRYLMFDCDGDKSLVVKDRTLTKIAKRNMTDIRPLAYDLKKAQPAILTPESMYQGMIHAYTGGNIGPISNNITKIWNSGQIGQEQLDVVKWLCFENNAVIDYAKTLWLPERPKHIDKIIKRYTKSSVPHFFIYAKDKDDTQVEQTNESTMNRISDSIPDARVKYNKNIGKFDWRMLINSDVDYTIREDSEVVKYYNYWLRNRSKFNDELDNIKDGDDYISRRVREEILAASGEDLPYVVNSLVAYAYTVKKSSNRKMLWACFGWDMVRNLERNLAGIGKICPICGKRFKPRDELQKYCGSACYDVAERQRAKDAWESPKPKTSHGENLETIEI